MHTKQSLVAWLNERMANLSIEQLRTVDATISLLDSPSTLLEMLARERFNDGEGHDDIDRAQRRGWTQAMHRATELVLADRGISHQEGDK